jgi:hypothetical protein
LTVDLGGNLVPGQYALYRYFDARDVGLYIGKSGVLAQRNSAHIARSQWMQFATRSAFERYGTPEELAAAEREAIEAEHPIFNKQYNDTPEARERLRTYLEEAGRLDLLPTRPLRTAEPLTEPGDVLELLRQIVTADTADHAKVRLRAVAALEGYADLPRGEELERLAGLAQLSNATAYSARKVPRPALVTP